MENKVKEWSVGSYCVALKKVEMFQRDVIVGRGGIIDATEWIIDLPKTTK